jgi:queuosine precursor transporter
MTDLDPQPVAAVHAGRMTRADATYTVLAASFAVVLVLTNIIGTKLFALFPSGGPEWINGGQPITLTAGIVTYPLTFWLTDIVSELWGRRRADLMVLLGFGMSFLMLGIVQVALVLPPSDFWTLSARGIEDSTAMQSAFDATFHNPRILLFASMLAYMVAQLFDVRLYHFWWRVTKGRHMWIRNNGSTMISQLVDTIIVNGIFLRWGLSLEWATIGEIIVWVYVCKVMLAWIDTPLLYLGRGVLRRFLGLESQGAPTHAPLA